LDNPNANLPNIGLEPKDEDGEGRGYGPVITVDSGDGLGGCEEVNAWRG